MKQFFHFFKNAHPVKQIIFLLWIVAFFSGIIFSAFYVSENGIEKSIANISANVFSWKIVFLYWIIFLVRNVVFVPISPLLVATPLVFGGFLEGLFVAGTSLLWGSVGGFFLARYYGKEFLPFEKSKLLSVVNKKLEKHGVMSIIILRFIPIFPFDVINFGSGLSKISFQAFFVATAISVWPDCALLVILGESVENPRFLLFVVLFFVCLAGFLWYLKTHPHFRDFFVFTLKKRTEKLKKRFVKFRKKMRGKKRF